MSETLWSGTLSQAVGLAVLHFLWQGAAIALVSGVILSLLHRAEANTRYLVGCLGLLVMMASPALTLSLAMRSETAPRSHAWPTESAAMVTSPSIPLVVSPGIPFFGEPTSSRMWRQEARRLLPLVAFVWAFGVLALTGRLLRNWLAVSRIRRQSVTRDGDGLIPVSLRIAAQLGITTPFRVAQSALVEVPMVIGWLRPAILVPTSALAQLSPPQLDAIIAHELAHIRRHDYLINVCQNLVETVLFFHPAVWWLSNRIRLEREQCCDDAAVAVCRDRVSYARALVALEESRQSPETLALAATGGSLVTRVQRLLGAPQKPHARVPGWLALGLLVVTTTGLIAAHPQRAAVTPELPATAVQGPGATDLLAGPDVPKDTAPVTLEKRTGLRTVDGRTVLAGRDASIQPAITSPATQAVPATFEVVGVPQGRAVIAGHVTPGDFQALLDAEQRFRQAKMANDLTALTALLEEGYFALNQAGQSHDKASALGMYQSIAFHSLAVSTDAIRVAGEVATVSGTQVERRSNGADSMLFVRIWRRQPAGHWRLLSNSQFNNPRSGSAPVAGSEERLLDHVRFQQTQPEEVVLQLTPTVVTPALVDLRGNGVTPPRKIRDVRPVLRSGMLVPTGTAEVILNAVVDETGNVTELSVVRSVPTLDQAALEAVRLWRFEPARIGGVPVAARVTLVVEFGGSTR